MANLSNLKVSQSFQRLLQVTNNGQVQNGTGSVVSLNISGSFTGSHYGTFSGSFTGDGSQLTGINAVGNSNWFSGSTYLTSSKNILISGSMFISSSKTLHLGGGDGYHVINGLGMNVVSQLEAHSEGNTDVGGIAIHRHTSITGYGGHLVFLRSNGSHNSPTINADGNTVARIMAAGYDGSMYGLAGEIKAEIDGTPQPNSVPGRWIISTTPLGTVLPVTRIRINSNGKIEFSGSVYNNQSLIVGNYASRAYGTGSFAQGSFVTATGASSHAQGVSTTAIGVGSHAEGESTVAYGQSSLAAGLGTIASGSYQSTFGKFNLKGNTTSLFVIGHGSSNTQRADILRVEPNKFQVSGAFALTGSNGNKGNFSFNHNNPTFSFDWRFYSSKSLHIESFLDSSLQTRFNFVIGQDVEEVGVYTTSLVARTGSHKAGVYVSFENGINKQPEIKLINQSSGGIGNISVIRLKPSESAMVSFIGSTGDNYGFCTYPSGGAHVIYRNVNTNPVAFSIRKDVDITIVDTPYHRQGSPVFTVFTNESASFSGNLKVTGSITLARTHSLAPAWTGTDGEIVPATVGGQYLLYMWMNGAWRSSSFV